MILDNANLIIVFRLEDDFSLQNLFLYVFLSPNLGLMFFWSEYARLVGLNAVFLHVLAFGVLEKTLSILE